MQIIDHKLTFTKPRQFRTKTTAIVLHHTDGDFTLEQLHKSHINIRGYIGIGYNFLVYQDGSIHLGRGWEYVEAHMPAAAMTTTARASAFVL